MTINRRALLTSAAGALAVPVLASAAASAIAPAFDTRAVVEAAAKALRERYVDPAVANELADLLLRKLASGAYDSVADPVKFADLLTDDIRSRVNDLHLSVQYDPPVPRIENAAIVAEDDLHPRFTGWGIQTVARLPGNIGLLKVTHFPSPPKVYGHHYAAAMELLADTAALIIDFTVNHGGGTDTGGYFLSYFLDGGITVSHSVSRGEPDEIIITDAKVPAPRYGTTRPLYVAISGNTFSAGEGIAAKLKELKRASLVGSQTRGGAHMGNFTKLPFGFQIFIVTGMGIGPNWEGVGITPDVAVQPEYAVATAHRLALETLLAQTKDEKTAQVLRNVRDHTVENLSSFSL